VLLAIAAVGACREPATFDIPPVTTAVAPPPSASGTPVVSGDAVAPADAAAGSLLAAATAPEPPVKASFVDAPANVDAALCSRVLLAVAKGKVTTMGETLGAGDVLVVTYPDPLKLEGAGLVVVVHRDLPPCAVSSRPVMQKKVVRANAAPDQRWAGGTMSAHLDVGSIVSPDLYLGRLEGTAGVPEHVHPGTWEILAAVDAHGTFVLDGTEGHLGPRQIVMVPPGAKHAWKPDPGTKLVAVQLYSPPGPEQRFVALAAADKDAGSRDAH
jgi:mannose-6-phosphate isomerase-like protein (cupin superfamily)